MSIETNKELKELSEKFTKLHSELLKHKLYDLATDFSKVYYQSQSASYAAGMDFMKEINNL